MFLFVYFLILIGSTTASNTTDFTKYVNLFIGTEGDVPGSAFRGGNFFPGATLPFGAVKVGIDTTRYNTSYAANAGYLPITHSNVTAITLHNISGTGGASTYGQIPQMPLTNLTGVNLLDNLTYMQPRTVEDVASVGYFRTHLGNGVTAEMSAGMHVGMMRYRYPEGRGRYVLVDVSHFLPSAGKKEQWYGFNGFVFKGRGWLTGKGIRMGFWRGVVMGLGILGMRCIVKVGQQVRGDYRVYFCGHFDSVPIQSQLFWGKYTDPFRPNTTGVVPTFTNASSIQGGALNYQYAHQIGALFEFSPNISTVTSKVGISWISTEKACQFLDEIPTWDLNAMMKAVKNEWNEQVLSKIDATSTNET
ncbi:hypothetical protein HYALB_00012187 [Hymenoscyphus albidus]|uniref:Glycosyl hydrolase family 92 N-terminal domain-containing protein n=1 Tax=Hymenoscyphus albidus TaxID=595503 RepID=A0A9N9LH03_9HELO|nr:hypothetical protein HYALB_00012187 [Hymenoscyphus albidus]